MTQTVSDMRIHRDTMVVITTTVELVVTDSLSSLVAFSPGQNNRQQRLKHL